MVDKQESTKWEFEITEEMKHVTPQQLWPLLADFCALNKLFIHIDNCYLVEGVPGEAGVVRCCESSVLSGAEPQYAKEKLIEIDPSKMWLTFEVIENNAGFKSYVATMKLFPIEGDGKDGKCGCKFVWSISVDPVEGFSKEAFFGVFKSMAQGMAKRMEETFSQK